MELNLTKVKTDSKIAGVFFIFATVFSIIGLKLYDPLLQSANFLITANANGSNIILGAINELILAASATGTGLMLYPYLKRYKESMGMGYLSFRLLEVVFIVIGIVSVLTALSVSNLYATGVISDKANAEGLGAMLIAMHNWTFILGPNFMLAINTFIYSYVFYKTMMVPRSLSKYGLFSASLIMIAAILELFGILNQVSPIGFLFALPIASYEMILAGWLIKKGLKLEG